MHQTGSLDLSNLGLPYLPDSLFSLRHLRHLDLGGSRQDLSYNLEPGRVAASLGRLQELAALETLSLSGRNLDSLEPIRSLTALKSLDLSGTAVSDLAPLSGLRALETLNCIRSNIRDLAPLAHLTALQSFYCTGTLVTDLTPIRSLKAMRLLNCGGTLVTDLAPLSGLTALESLLCGGTPIRNLEPIVSLKALQWLDCVKTQISDLAPLRSLTSLHWLYCSDSHISDLTPLTGLSALQSLDCSNTQITSLAPLADLADLQTLYCYDCRLKSLPESIWKKLPSLRKLGLHGSTVPGIPREVLSTYDEDVGCLNALRAHFADLAIEPAELSDVRLLLLGNGGVGKTQIAGWLSGADFNPAWDSTHGIKLNAAPPDGTLAAKLHLQIWDFGGQDIYHGTHALFLKNPAILMPIWTPEKENSNEYPLNGITFRNYPLAYWVEIVRQQGSPHSPVLIVQSQCDNLAQEKRDFPVPAETLRAMPNYKPLWVSALKKRGMAALEEALGDAIDWLRDPARLGTLQIGAGRLRVQRRLEALRDADQALPPAKRKHRLLDRAAFNAICEEEGGVTSSEHLLDFLDANGTVIHVGGRIVLDQAWALEAIYAVFDRENTYKVLISQAGRFTRRLLGGLIWQDKSEAEQKLFLDLMQSCGMCFLHRKNDDDADSQYIAPDLLPFRHTVENALADRWDDEIAGETIVFSYALLHGGLIRAVMSAIGDKADSSAIYWRGGLYGFDAQTRSKMLIEQEMTGEWQGNITVRTQGGQAAALQDWAAKIVEQMQDRLGLKPHNVQRSAPPARGTPELKPEFVADPPAKRKPRPPKWYVSYAWGDDTPEGRMREEKVNQLCENAKAKGVTILRDKEVMRRGDSIGDFMKSLAAGKRIYVFLSDKYLQSVYCMTELSEIWRQSKNDPTLFNKKVQIYALPGTKLSDVRDPIHWGRYWKKEYEILSAEPRDALGEYGDALLRRLQSFYLQTADILGAVKYHVQARDVDELSFD